MSPELLALDHSRLKNNRLTKQSDCYAFGMVIYEVLSGRAPFSRFNHYSQNPLNAEWWTFEEIKVPS